MFLRRGCAAVLAALILSVRSECVAAGEVDLRFAEPEVSIGIDITASPKLVPLPGYPVYYSPELETNLFFYDGLYWDFFDDRWYESEWYDGPWRYVDPSSVPYFILRIPVRYYRVPPVYFGGWDRRRPPRWGDHWGRDWEQGHHDWDRWDHRQLSPRSPPPDYQREDPRDHHPSRDVRQPTGERDDSFRQWTPGGPPPKHDRRPQPTGDEPPIGEHRRVPLPPAHTEATEISRMPPQLGPLLRHGPGLPAPQYKDEPAARNATNAAGRRTQGSNPKRPTPPL